MCLSFVLLQICKHASDKRVEKVVAEAVEMYSAEGADSDARWAVRLMHFLRATLLTGMAAVLRLC